MLNSFIRYYIPLPILLSPGRLHGRRRCQKRLVFFFFFFVCGLQLWEEFQLLIIVETNCSFDELVLRV